MHAGVARVVAGLASDQVARGWQVTVACPAQGWLPEALTATGVDVVRWEATRSPGLSVVTETRSLSALIRQVDPDVVHLHSAKAGLAGRLAVRGRRPTVFQPHAWSFDAVSGPVRRLSQEWERRASRWTHLTVCVSEAEAAAGRAVGVHGRLEVTPNGIDTARWPTGDRAASRARLGVPEAPTVVCVGRYARQKGQDLLVEAWRTVVAQVPGARLVFVGDGVDHPELLAAAPAGVHVAPNSDLADWYAAATVVAVPSRWEAGLPLVAMEAMSTARSVVAFDVAGIGSGLGDSGEAVPAEDTAALARALVERLVDEPAADAEGRTGRGRVFELFTATRSHADIARLTEELLQLHR
ncbi:glycosyl transferase [Klenkia taihuensis]|uniref:Glycosyltransferase involved in cell wall bisynthesis n=1 Tax=Klenkia taihuensis TaxID=1225127 RepID=A0A1I1NP16_9ACTN|nr:glycosyl transferase [Klenkia taihuensis]SFC99434.1 Glycosyltransferase involved in cell wall bisynthesis [Klenkia taihuensis]